MGHVERHRAGRTRTSAGSRRRSGDLEEAEKLFRESIRLLKPLGERGHLCESQRASRRCSSSAGKLDEAERFALEARETVGPRTSLAADDAMSRSASCAPRRAATSEAEELLRGAVDQVTGTRLPRRPSTRCCSCLAQFLRERGRDDEALPFEARLAELTLLQRRTKSSARIA